MRLLIKQCDILAAEQGKLQYYQNAYLGINSDTIDYIGVQRPNAQYEQEKAMPGKMLMPGLINCHGHSGMVLMRGLGSDMCLQDWLEKMYPIEGRMRLSDHRSAAALALLEMIQGGTTSFSDMYLQPRLMIELAAQAGIKANVAKVITCFDDEQKYENFTAAKESMELFHEFHGGYEDRIRIDFAIHAEYTCKPWIVKSYAEDCRSVGGRMQIHLSETKREHEECIDRYGKTPAKWFYDLGVFDSPTAAAHCVWVSEGDMELMREKNVSAIHNPSSNMKLGSGFAPIPKMMKKGINVALGTDGAASNNNLNMFEELHLASIIHNGYANDATIMPPSETIAMATANAAKLQGREDTGSLEIGKKADIIAVDLSGIHLQPNLDPLALLTYTAQNADVCMTMVNGRILYENGEFLTMDREQILRDVQSSVKHLYR